MGSRNRHVLPILLFGGVLLGACAPQAVVPKGEKRVIPRAEMRIQGTLDLKGVSVPLAGMKITAGEGVVAVAGRDNTFGFPDLPPGKNNLVAEKLFADGPVRRVLGVATVFVGSGPVRFSIPVRDATEVDGFCSECHPYVGKKTRNDQIIRCVHRSGVKSKYKKIPTAPLDSVGRITCESCHTIHRETGIPHFVRLSYGNGKLCNQCH